MFKSRKNKAAANDPSKKANGKTPEPTEEEIAASVIQKLLAGSKNGPGKDEIVISGLGTAAKNAIASATIMDKEKSAMISKIETSCHWDEKFHKSIPKISIVLKKFPTYIAESA